MPTPLLGLHHVTALAADPNENHDFHVRTLGLRLVKRTVNFDDPFTWHLYFGDARGTPGTLLTHFPDPRVRPGRHGTPEILETILRIPRGSMDRWAERLLAAGTAVDTTGDAEEPRLAFEDPHTMRYVMVETDHDAAPAPWDGGVPAADAITGIEGVVVHVPDVDETAGFLRDVLGFRDGACTPDGERLHLGGERIELVRGEHARPVMGAGTVHHVAWRVPDDDAQRAVADRLAAAGIAATEQKDRQYFRSIYFRIPGGVIFEVATDGPGFDVDERPETLGTELRLPPPYEARRADIEPRLVPIAVDAPSS